MNDDAFRAWIESTLGHAPQDPALFARALTHGSHGPADYERLEFLGDRVLGLVAADWLYALFPDEPKASSRAGSTRSSAAKPAPRSRARSTSSPISGWENRRATTARPTATTCSAT